MYTKAVANGSLTMTRAAGICVVAVACAVIAVSFDSSQPIASETDHAAPEDSIVSVNHIGFADGTDYIASIDNIGPNDSLDPISFNRQIRPILTRNCFLCHGFDVSTREAELRLDIFEGATASRGEGEPVPIVPGDAGASELIRRVSATDPDDHMPPGERVPLTPDQIDLLRQWINEGANYDQHWSWKPVRNPAVPVVDDPRFGGWEDNPIDGFVFDRLRNAGLEPSPPADRRTLIRRLSFDITGLPPTPEEVEAFVDDASENAYEQVVDRLLASPRYGERWARHWLDLARYAESYGHEFDYTLPHAWRYRDYVIRALNDDVPYDQFVTEQIAGDLVDSPRVHPTDGYNESIIGTGFWLLSQGTHSPVDVRLDEAERVDNQIDVFSKTFMATTVACARCHDHKFDQITTKDYYGLAGYLRSSSRRESMLDQHGRIAEAAAKISTHNEEITSLFADVQLSKTRVTSHLRAVNEALHGTPKPGELPAELPPTIFDDFEDGNLDGWTVEGTAFSGVPQTQETIGSWQGEVGANGNGFINSHQIDNGEETRAADDHVGSMTSDAFTISLPFIQFLIGGGNHKGKTCLELVIDDEVVRTATGHNSNKMRQAEFSVSELIGRQAVLRIADRQKGGWGNIGIDHIAFTDRSMDAPLLHRNVEAVALEFGVTETMLEKWLKAIGGMSADDVTHAMAPWVIAMNGSPEDIPSPFELADEDPQYANDVLFEDFSNGIEDWRPDGAAMGHGLSALGDIWQTPERPRITTTKAAHSGLIATELQGALQSDDFTIETDYIHYRLAGKSSRVRLIIDGYFLDSANALLFGGMIIPVNNENYRWHVQDVHRYKGRRAHIQILDEGDGWVAVDEIWFSNARDPRKDTADPSWLLQLFEEKTIDGLATVYGDAIAWGVSRWEPGRVAPAHAVLIDWLIASDLLTPERAQLEPLLEQRAALIAKVPAPVRALTLREGTPSDEYVFIRGDHQMRGDDVPRHFPRMLAGAQSTITEGSGRLELATRLLDERNPLPARVMANRVWQHMIGTPIVGSPDDFGSLGDQATHPDLLDYLATWYRGDANWSTKALIRHIALSQTYQMSSARTDPKAEVADPNNELLHRANIKRLEGESIRDAVLAISGRLDTTMFGPSIPIHLTPFMTGRGRPGKSGPLDGDGRRSIYIAVKRNFLSPFMQAFDMPVPFTSIGKRNVSNVPAQSLILMNDPLIVQQAQLFADRILALGGLTTDERINRIHLAAFARDATQQEIDQMTAFLKVQADDNWQTNPDAWRDLCHVIFNRKEFIFLN